jgi:hypothetical protein
MLTEEDGMLSGKWLAALVVVGLAGCGAPAATEKPVTVIVKQTVAVPQTVVVPQTVIVRETVVAPQTVVVKVAAPTAPAPVAKAVTPTPAATSEINIPKIIDSTDQVQDRGGVLLMVEGAGLFDWAAGQKLDDEWVKAIKDARPFLGAQALGSLSVVVTNTTGGKVNLYPGQGVVVVGSEQIELTSFGLYGDDVDGTLFPGVTKKGVILFALKNTPWSRVSSGSDMTLEVGAPVDSESYKKLANAPYTFTMRLK